jgi:hypothetical protein
LDTLKAKSGVISRTEPRSGRMASGTATQKDRLKTGVLGVMGVLFITIGLDDTDSDTNNDDNNENDH